MMKRQITPTAHITSGNSLPKQPHVQQMALNDFNVTRYSYPTGQENARF
jgi:hypothetical protein